MIQSGVYRIGNIRFLRILAGLIVMAGMILLFGGCNENEKAPLVSEPIKEFSVQSDGKNYTVNLVVSYDKNMFMFMLYDSSYTNEKRKLIDSIEIVSPAIGLNPTADDLLHTATANFAEVYTIETANDSPMDVFCFRYPKALDRAGRIYGYVTEFFSISSQTELFQFEIQTSDNPIAARYDFNTSDALGAYFTETLSDPYAYSSNDPWVDSSMGYQFTFDMQKQVIKAASMETDKIAGLRKLAASRYSPLTYGDLLVRLQTIQLPVGELSEDGLSIVNFIQDAQTVNLPLLAGWTLDATVLYDNHEQKVGEIAPAVRNAQGLLDASFFTIDEGMDQKIHLLDQYTLTSASLVPEAVLAAWKKSAAFPDMIFPEPEGLSSIPENITVYHTFTSEGLFEKYSYVIELDECAYILVFHGTEVSRPIFDRIAENFALVQEAS